MKKKVFRILSAVFILLLLFLIIGFISEKLRSDKLTNYPPVGNFIAYEDSSIHYVKKGSGRQTVVFSSGSGTSSPYFDMFHLQNEINELTETITIERPGYGWSESTERKRTIEQIGEEMEAVLNEASENESFIFVGHSMAALAIFYFAQKHPQMVDGIVLIDGVLPEYASEMEDSVPVSIHVMRLLNSTGVLRLLSNFDFMKQNMVQQQDLSEKDEEKALAITLDRMWNQTMLVERQALNSNGQTVNEGNKLENIPLIIFSAVENPMSDWKESQEKLQSWSNLAEQIWIDTANHFIHLEEPGLVLEKIEKLLGNGESSSSDK